MCIIHSRNYFPLGKSIHQLKWHTLTQGDRRCRANILVGKFIQHRLESISRYATLVDQHVVVGWPGRPLKGGMGTEIPIIFERMGHVFLDQSSG